MQAERKSGQPEESEKIVEVERINMQKTELRTKNAMEIMKVIGDCDELKEFDELRYRLKSAKKKILRVISLNIGKSFTNCS